MVREILIKGYLIVVGHTYMVLGGGEPYLIVLDGGGPYSILLDGGGPISYGTWL